ncbi:MAG: hypothetical protein HY693_03545 [Deltaproteobacteria bacterium]|nr:hypothetical protein [Deltaproteobacteria bacterium]
MNRILIITSILLVGLILGLSNVRASHEALSVDQFRQLYDSLLAGKTLVSEIKKEGMGVRKERIFGKAIDVSDGKFEIPVKIIITSSKDGEVQQRIAIDVRDVVNNLGGSAIINEQVRKTSIENKGQEPFTTDVVEFQGEFHVQKNDKGGFNVHNFGLQPSVLVKDGTTTLAGSMVLYSCFPETGDTKCVLTIRDYVLGEYKPLEGFTLVEPAGGDVVEVGVEVKQ